MSTAPPSPKSYAKIPSLIPTMLLSNRLPHLQTRTSAPAHRKQSTLPWTQRWPRKTPNPTTATNAVNLLPRSILHSQIWDQRALASPLNCYHPPLPSFRLPVRSQQDLCIRRCRNNKHFQHSIISWPTLLPPKKHYPRLLTLFSLRLVILKMQKVDWGGWAV